MCGRKCSVHPIQVVKVNAEESNIAFLQRERMTMLKICCKRDKRHYAKDEWDKQAEDTFAGILLHGAKAQRKICGVARDNKQHRHMPHVDKSCRARQHTAIDHITDIHDSVWIEHKDQCDVKGYEQEYA